MKGARVGGGGGGGEDGRGCRRSKKGRVERSGDVGGKEEEGTKVKEKSRRKRRNISEAAMKH